MDKNAQKQYRLPKEFAEKWIAELRSGKHEQIKGMLCDGAGFCCLGIADSIVAGNEKSDWGTIPQYSEGVPKEIIGDNTLTAKLTSMNDEGNKTFPEIADWIESSCELY